MQRNVYIWTIIALILFLPACGNKKQTDKVIPNDYKVTLIADGSNPHRLLFDLKEKGTDTPTTLSGRMIHALVIPPDFATLYHDHPIEVREGRYELLLDYLPTDGPYDIWLEVSIGSDHLNAFFQRFPVQLKAGGGQAPEAVSPRLGLTSTPTGTAEQGKSSWLTFEIALDGKPPAKYGQYKNVAVHSFAVSKNREVLVHDHAEPLKNGVVQARFTFPDPGDYVIFLQPTVVADGVDIRTMLRHEVTVR